MADIQPVVDEDDEVRDQDKIMLILGYLGILALIPYITVKDSEYVRWHARQGLALSVVYVAWSLASFIIMFIPVVRYLLFVMWPVVMIGTVVIAIMGIVRALHGRRWAIPLVSDVAALLPL